MDKNCRKYSLEGLGEVGLFLPLPRDRMKYAWVVLRCSSDLFFKMSRDEVSTTALNTLCQRQRPPVLWEVTKVNTKIPENFCFIQFEVRWEKPRVVPPARDLFFLHQVEK